MPAMKNAERFRLLHGPYMVPRCKIGRKLRCHIRGKVKVTDISNGRIPWPQTRVATNRAYILCGDLAKAVRCESALAIRYWWGVGASTVRTWRRALGVSEYNEGTLRLHRDWMPERLTEEERARALAAMNSPEANAKKSAAKLGVPRPLEVAAKIRRANLGRRASAETRQKMSEAHKARGTKPPGVGIPWTPEEDALLGTMPDRDVAAKLGRSARSVWDRRQRLGIPRVVVRER